MFALGDYEILTTTALFWCRFGSPCTGLSARFPFSQCGKNIALDSSPDCRLAKGQFQLLPGIGQCVSFHRSSSIGFAGHHPAATKTTTASHALRAAGRICCVLGFSGRSCKIASGKSLAIAFCWSLNRRNSARNSSAVGIQISTAGIVCFCTSLPKESERGVFQHCSVRLAFAWRSFCVFFPFALSRGGFG